MEKKTNKAKLEILKFFEKISVIERLQPMIKYDLIMPLQILKNMLIRVFLHAEFISAVKTCSKSYDFHEKCKRIEK